MKITWLDIPGLALIETPVFRDARGFFIERFKEHALAEHGLRVHFIQDNHSRSLPRVLRGLHFQVNPAQGKLVSVIRGRVWDVAVDIRPDSPTFGKHFGAELSDENGLAMWIPPGFAHGFCVLGDEPADLLYKVDSPYTPSGERGLYWADPELAIRWPVSDPIVSVRDGQLGSFIQLRASRAA